MALPNHQNHTDLGRWAYDVVLLSEKRGPAQALSAQKQIASERLPKVNILQLLGIRGLDESNRGFMDRSWLHEVPNQ